MKYRLETLVDQLKAASLWGLPFSVGDDGTLTVADSMTKDQRDALATVLAAHDPSVLPAPNLAQLRDNALDSLKENPLAQAAMDGFIKSIKARQDLPKEVTDYIAKAKL